MARRKPSSVCMQFIVHGFPAPVCSDVQSIIVDVLVHDLIGLLPGAEVECHIPLDVHREVGILPDVVLNEPVRSILVLPRVALVFRGIISIAV